MLGKAVNDLPDLAVAETNRRHDLGHLLPLGREPDDAGVAIGSGIGRAEQLLHLALLVGGEGTNVKAHDATVLPRAAIPLTSDPLH